MTRLLLARALRKAEKMAPMSPWENEQAPPSFQPQCPVSEHSSISSRDKERCGNSYRVCTGETEKEPAAEKQVRTRHRCSPGMRSPKLLSGSFLLPAAMEGAKWLVASVNAPWEEERGLAEAACTVPAS